MTTTDVPFSVDYTLFDNDDIREFALTVPNKLKPYDLSNLTTALAYAFGRFTQATGAGVVVADNVYLTRTQVTAIEVWALIEAGALAAQPATSFEQLLTTWAESFDGFFGAHGHESGVNPKYITELLEHMQFVRNQFTEDAIAKILSEGGSQS